MPLVAIVLFWLNALFLAGLLVATVVRAVSHPQPMASDIRDHRRGLGFLTIVAALAVFGTQLDLQMGQPRLAAVTWTAAAALWAVMSYGLLAVRVTLPDKPRLADLNGGWMIVVVAAQSVAILAVLLLARGVFAVFQQSLMFAALALWLAGGALYLCLMVLVLARYVTVPLGPRDLSPLEWINMGAGAISTLAGATLAQNAGLSPLTVDLLPFVKGLTTFFWSVATWWLPLLVLMALWRHLIRGVPFAYEVVDWGAVFPLGMYSVSTDGLAMVLDTPILGAVSWLFTVIALAAWVLTLLGLLASRFGPAAAERQAKP
jgi:tellurite resistance protein TehA-like permease